MGIEHTFYWIDILNVSIVLWDLLREKSYMTLIREEIRLLTSLLRAIHYTQQNLGQMCTGLIVAYNTFLDITTVLGNMRIHMQLEDLQT